MSLWQSDSRKRRRFRSDGLGIYLRRCLQAPPANTKLATTEPPGDGEPKGSIPTPLLSIRWIQPGSCNRAEHPAVTPAFPSSRAAQTQTHPSRETGTGSPRPGHCQAHFIPTADPAKLRVIGEGSAAGQGPQQVRCGGEESGSAGRLLLVLLVVLLVSELPPRSFLPWPNHTFRVIVGRWDSRELARCSG